MKKILSFVFSFLLLVSLFSTSMEVYAAVADAKIDTDLKSAISESETGTSLAYVILTDVDSDEVMKQFQERYPLEYKTYMFAKFDDPGDMTDKEIAAIDDELLQRAIECKREVYREYYTAQNESVIGRYYSEDEIVFMSQYSPMAIVETDTLTASRISRSSEVCSLSVYHNMTAKSTSDSQTEYDFDEIISNIDNINQQSGVTYVRDTRGYSGAGVKIGMVEPVGRPDTSATSCLSGSNITIRPADAQLPADDHATAVAAVMVSKDSLGIKHGVAPDAQLYFANASEDEPFYVAVEWLISCGVNIINFSMWIPVWSHEDYDDGDGGDQVNLALGQYDKLSQWMDHIAVQHDVHVVNASGNDTEEFGSDLNGKVPPLAMAYNAITVGAVEQYNGGDSGHLGADVDIFPEYQTATYSCYLEYGSVAEKPNLVADGTLYLDNDPDNNVCGTSFAAPQVAGVIAQLCTYNSALKYKQTAVSAILMASAAEKVEPLVGTDGTRGCVFDPSVQVESNPQVSDKAGAGIMNARMALGIATAGNYWSPTVYNSGFPYTKTVYIDATVNTVNRVVIFWLKRNTVTDHTSGTVNVTTYPIANLNLEVFDPNGVSLGTSTLTKGNFEIVQFFPETSGNYTIKITGSSSEKEYIGIALW